MASPSSVTTMGFGTGTFAGTIALVVTLGYGIGSQGATLVYRWEEVLEIDLDPSRVEVDVIA